MDEYKRARASLPAGVAPQNLMDPEDRGDISGTFERPVTSAPSAPSTATAAPIGRVALRRLATPPPPPVSTGGSDRPAAAPLRPVSELEDLSADAMEAVDFGAVSERVEFPDFGLRLDVPTLPPAPTSLLPLPGEERPSAFTIPRTLGLLAVLLVAAAVGWFGRSATIASPALGEPAPGNVATRPDTDVVASTPVTAFPVVEQVLEPAVVEDEPEALAVVEETDLAATELVRAEPAAVAEPTAATIKADSRPVARVADRAAATTTTSATATTDATDAPVAVATSEDAPEPTAATPAAPVTSIVGVATPTAATEAEHLANDLPATLDREEVIEGIELLRNEYRQCAGEKHGLAAVRLTISGATGRVTFATVGGDFVGTPEGSCLARTLRQAQFRPFAQARLEVAYPIAL